MEARKFYKNKWNRDSIYKKLFVSLTSIHNQIVSQISGVVRTPCPMFGYLPVKLESSFLHGKYNVKKNCELIVNFEIASVFEWLSFFRIMPTAATNPV